jgi:phage terminase small subunit
MSKSKEQLFRITQLGILNMPVLRNQRRELFAQEIAKGKTAAQAMRTANYSDPRNSTRLKNNDEVRRRVDELKERGAIRAEVTIASLVQELEDARQLAVERGQASAAVAATMGKAKVTGQIIDRAEVRTPDDFEDKTIEELIEIVSKGLGELGYSVQPSSTHRNAGAGTDIGERARPARS